MSPRLTKTVRIFLSYAHEDEPLLSKLYDHLRALTDGGRVVLWHDRMIPPSGDWEASIKRRMKAADIILLLVSSNYFRSDYCRGKEMPLALERHHVGKARAIPVILKPYDWESGPLGKLQALPKEGKPIVLWGNRDTACTDVTKGVRAVVDALLEKRPDPPRRKAPGGPRGKRQGGGPKPPPPGQPAPRPRPSIPRPPRAGFVARRDERGRGIVEQLKAALAPRRPRLITVWGPRGVGKTKLAAEVARALTADYRGRVVWSDAVTRTDYTLQSLLDDIAEQLGRPDLRSTLPPGRKDARAPGEREAQVRELFLKAPTLVVLDTSERVEPKERDVIEQWLGGAAGSALFVSLHESGGMENVAVPFMTPDESAELTRRLVWGAWAAPLFTPEILHRVHRLTGGGPLLIRWVVAQILGDPRRSPDGVLAELERGEGAPADRIFDRFFTLPSPGADGRAVLLALSLFKPSAARPALAEAAGFRGSLKRLDKAVADLRAVSLLGIEDQHGRLRLQGQTLDLVETRLARDGAADDFRRRFVRYFTAHAAGFNWSGCRDLGAVETERSNILMAMQLAPRVRDWDAAVELFSATRGSVYLVKELRSAVKLAEDDAEERLSAGGGHRPPVMIEIYHPNRQRARALYEALLGQLPAWKIVEVSISKFQLGVFDYYRAEELSAPGQEDAKRLPPKARRLMAEARRQLAEAKKLKEKFDDLRGVAITQNNLGVVVAREQRAGWRAEAEGHLNDALKYFEDTGSRFAAVTKRNLRWLEGGARGGG